MAQEGGNGEGWLRASRSIIIIIIMIIERWRNVRVTCMHWAAPGRGTCSAHSAMHARAGTPAHWFLYLFNICRFIQSAVIPPSKDATGETHLPSSEINMSYPLSIPRPALAPGAEEARQEQAGKRSSQEVRNPGGCGASTENGTGYSSAQRGGTGLSSIRAFGIPCRACVERGPGRVRSR